MEKTISGCLNKILTAFLILLVGLFAFSLFKNIQYPLLWQDEADTAMFGKRILQFGYPKAHDGKNYINPFYPPNFSYAVDKKSDAYLYQGWSIFYVASLGEKFASSVSDIYLKTAFLRIPFAILGFLGIIIFALIIKEIFSKNKINQLFFLILFFILEIFSISLTLHLREVRYYSLVVFLSASILYIYFRYKFFKNLKFAVYCSGLIFLLFLIFNTFYPIYFIFVITIGLYELYSLFPVGKINAKLFYPFIPLIISIISVIPLMLFFKIFKTSSEFSSLFRYNFSIYLNHIFQIFGSLSKFEYLALALTVKFVLRLITQNGTSLDKDKELKKMIRISVFLSLFFVVYVLFIAQNPIFVFTRYFIVLQPILIIILLIDLYILYGYLSGNYKPKIRKANKIIYLSLLFFVFIISSIPKITLFENHIYELFHQYEGPLDYIIPYIKNNYPNPDKLVIATNYEETSYMYYLGSKVTIGYTGNNLDEDRLIQPDIISIRPMSMFISPQIFINFLNKGKYKKITFPVYNSRVNNIPELNGQITHLFQTRLAQNEGEKLAIFVADGQNK